jgi:hypothetical protein
MRTSTILSLAFAAATLCIAPAASAGTLPAREVRINTERLARLPAAEQQRVLEIKDRLDELIAMDRSALDAAQRAELRSEWKGLKGEMKHFNRSGSVVYISTGALIIIILLLIILL